MTKTRSDDFKQPIEEYDSKKPGIKSAKNYFFQPLCLFHSYIEPHFSDDKTKKHGETYHRSELSPHTDKEPEKFCKTDKGKKELKQGGRAHFGAYANNFERSGDSFKTPPKKQKPSKISNGNDKTTGNAALYDESLNYKLSLCESLAGLVSDKPNIKAGFYNNYPCVMVYIKPISIFKSAENTHKPSEATLEAWSNFLISIYVGYVNYKAAQQNIPIELVRRSSFGFTTPTISVTGNSIRISMGIVPDTYLQVLADGLNQLDQLISDIRDPEKNNRQLINSFYGSDEHKKYLCKKYATPNLTNIFHSLWQQVEKNGKTTLQNLMRTANCRDGIAAKVYQSLNNGTNLLVAVTNATEWAISRLEIKNDTLSFNHDEISYDITSSENHEAIINDEKFWGFVNNIILSAKNNLPNFKDKSALIKALENKVRTKTISDIYNLLDVLNVLILISVLRKVSSSTKYEDGYESDSEEETTFDTETVYTKKLIVSNGMRAILAALLAIKNKLDAYSLFLDKAYYEVADAIKLINLIEGKFIHVEEKQESSCTVYLRDANACVTNGKADEYKVDINKIVQKILILDTTSSTTEQMHTHIENFSKSRATCLFFVSSGLKHEQFGADRNAYGTVRIFAKEKTVLDGYYDQIKKNEKSVNSPISHEYRRAEKKLGAVPTAAAMLKK